MKFENPSMEFLHSEHTRWLEEIKFYNNEIKFLKKILNNILINNNDESVTSKGKKYLNHLEHNFRLLKGITETIHAHESFLKHNLEFFLPPVEDNFEEDPLAVEEDTFLVTSDHDKTRQHLADFRKRYEKLKTKIYSLHDKINKKS